MRLKEKPLPRLFKKRILTCFLTSFGRGSTGALDETTETPCSGVGRTSLTKLWTRRVATAAKMAMK